MRVQVNCFDTECKFYSLSTHEEEEEKKNPKWQIIYYNNFMKSSALLRLELYISFFFL